jgi:RNA polymerase primary sigma factor
MRIESGLQFYLNQIAHVPPLSADREKELARRFIRENDPAAREEMIRANLRLVVHIAKQFRYRGAALQDLIEDGNLGLVKAVEGFNPKINIRFSTYATWWIKNAIQRALINCMSPIHVPEYVVGMIVKWKSAITEMNDQLGRMPTTDELSKHLKISAKRLRSIHRAAQAFQSTSETQMNSHEGDALHETLPDDKTPAPDNIVLGKDEIRTIVMLLNKLDQREADILRLRFGLKDGHALNLREIGDRLGLTNERVRQIENAALRKLNAYISADRLPVFNQVIGVTDGDHRPKGTEHASRCNYGDQRGGRASCPGGVAFVSENEEQIGLRNRAESVELVISS